MLLLRNCNVYDLYVAFNLDTIIRGSLYAFGDILNSLEWERLSEPCRRDDTIAS
jgi:hypothetical protein